MTIEATRTCSTPKPAFPLRKAGTGVVDARTTRRAEDRSHVVLDRL